MYHEVKTGDLEIDAFAEGASLLCVEHPGYNLFVHPDTERFPSSADSFRRTITAPEFGYLANEVVSSGRKNPRVIPQFISELSMFPVILNTACSYSSSGLLLVDFPRIDAVEVKFEMGGALETRIAHHFRSVSAPQVIDGKKIPPATHREIDYNVIKNAIDVSASSHETASSARKLILQSAFGDQGYSALVELAKHFRFVRASDAADPKSQGSDFEIYAATAQPRDPITQELCKDFVVPIAIFGRGHRLSIDLAYVCCERSVYRVLRRWRS